jgi:glycosyltransferase involved in cell wall biosynthesis
LGNNPPLKIYTYLASRKPIVATTMSAHTQVLSDSTAFLADPNPEAFSSALEAALCAAPATIANMTEAGASLIEREYSQNEFQKRLQAIYQALVPERDLIIEKRELHAVE